MSLAEGKWSADFHYRGGSRTAPIDNRAHLPGGRFAKRPYSNRIYSAVVWHLRAEYGILKVPERAIGAGSRLVGTARHATPRERKPQALVRTARPKPGTGRKKH